MITCTQVEWNAMLPWVSAGSPDLPNKPFPTLTEVATLAVYGVSLTREQFSAEVQRLTLEGSALWKHDVDGQWLRPYLKQMIEITRAGARPERLDCPPDHAEALWAWLSKGRKIIPLPGRYSAEACERHGKLATMSDLDALLFAQVEIERIALMTSEASEKARRLYETLSLAAASDEIILKGLQEYRNEPFAAGPVRPALAMKHVPLSGDDLIPHLGHDLAENVIELDPPNPREDPMNSYFDRRKRQLLEMSADWTDVRLSLSHAQCLIARVGAEPTRSETSESKCRMWLEARMRESLQQRPKPRDYFFAEAKELYPGLSKRAFDRAWNEGKRVTGAKWDAAGRPKVRRKQ